MRKKSDVYQQNALTEPFLRRAPPWACILKEYHARVADATPSHQSGTPPPPPRKENHELAAPAVGGQRWRVKAFGETSEPLTMRSRTRSNTAPTWRSPILKAFVMYSLKSFRFFEVPSPDEDPTFCVALLRTLGPCNGEANKTESIHLQSVFRVAVDDSGSGALHPPHEQTQRRRALGCDGRRSVTR